MQRRWSSKRCESGKCPHYGARRDQKKIPADGSHRPPDPSTQPRLLSQRLEIQFCNFTACFQITCSTSFDLTTILLSKHLANSSDASKSQKKPMFIGPFENHVVLKLDQACRKLTTQGRIEQIPIVK